MKNLKLELLTGALESARFGLCVVDDSGRIVLANAAFANKLGTSQEEILGQGYLLLQRHLGKHPSFFKLFNVREPELSIECEVSGDNDNPRYLLLQSSNMKHESGEVFRTVSAIDITDYGVTRDKFRALHRQMDAIGNAVVIVDARLPDMPISYVNKHFEQMTGYSSKETVGRNCRFLQNGESQQEGLSTLRDAIKARKSCQVTLRNFRKNGTPFVNELFVSPVFDDEGQLTHFVGVQHEVRPKASPFHA
jgi:PAS domain S-box-containing protein